MIILISLKSKPTKVSLMCFLLFYIGFIINFKSTQEYLCKLNLLNIIKQNLLGACVSGLLATKQ